MKAEFGEKKEFKEIAYQIPDPGQFALECEPSKTIHWDHCREQFANRFNELTTGFYFTHPTNKGENIANFLIKTEEIININNFSSFNKTTCDKILWISPSEFWKICEMRRSLLTIILRAGITYDIEQDNYETTLFSYPYVLKTRTAIIRFLYGFTKFTKENTYCVAYQKKGWVNFFENADVEFVRKSLVSDEKTSCLIGLETLWG